jgi:hypothetical protein
MVRGLLRSLTMQAFEIIYDQDETRVALGWPGGKVHICAVEADGSPGDEIAEVAHHKTTIVCLGFAGDRLVSLSDDGEWAVSDAATGQVISSGSAGGEFVTGSLSPGGEALFIYTCLDGDSRAFRVDVERGAAAPGPDIDGNISVTSRVFALDGDTALYHFIRKNWKSRQVKEGFVEVDFASGRASVRRFSTGPSTDFDSSTRMMSIDPIRRLGIRPDYQPVELVELDGHRRAVLRAEIFDIDNLEARARPVVLRWPVEHLGYKVDVLDTAEPGSEAFVEAQDWSVRWLCSARFVEGSEHAWVGVKGGIVRRLPLSGESPSAPIIHGGGPAGGGFTLDDVVARNLSNNHTLGVSRSGRYVGFGNPNDFFCTDDVDLEARLAVRLPERAAVGPVTEAPGRIAFAGDRLVVFDRAHRMFIADGASGEPDKTIELPGHYGDATAAAMSPDGAHIAVAVSGGEALLYDVAAGELTGLPVPPHTLLAAFTSDRRLYLVHHAGAVVAIDLEQQRVEVHRAGDEGYPDEVLEDMDSEELEYMRAMAVFEQRYDCYAGVVYRDGDGDRVGVIDENDELQLYAIGDDMSIEDGPAIDVAGHSLAAGDGWIAAAGGSEIRIVDPTRGEVINRLALEGPIRGLQTGSSTGALYAFDDRAGQLLRIADPRDGQREVVLEYRGASIAGVAISEPLGRAALVTASGAIELRDLDGGGRLATLRVEPRGGDVRELVREPA